MADSGSTQHWLSSLLAATTTLGLAGSCARTVPETVLDPVAGLAQGSAPSGKVQPRSHVAEVWPMPQDHALIPGRILP